MLSKLFASIHFTEALVSALITCERFAFSLLLFCTKQKNSDIVLTTPKSLNRMYLISIYVYLYTGPVVKVL